MNEDANTQENHEAPVEQKKTYSEDDIKNLLNAKNHEKEARQSAEAKIKELENKVFSLESQKYGDEEKILQSPLYKKLQADFAKMQGDYTSLENERNTLSRRLDANDIKNEILKSPEIIPAAADDILMHIQNAGFRRMEGKWLDENGQGISKFIDGLKETRPHYFKKARNNDAEEVMKRLNAVKGGIADPDQYLRAANLTQIFK